MKLSQVYQALRDNSVLIDCNGQLVEDPDVLVWDEVAHAWAELSICAHSRDDGIPAIFIKKQQE